MQNVCKQCSGPVVMPRGMVIPEKCDAESIKYLSTKILGLLCCDKCIEQYICRQILAEQVTRDVIVKCDYSQGYLSCEYLHGGVMEYKKTNPKLWDTTACFAQTCKQCGVDVQVPLYRTKNGAYYWTGTVHRYDPSKEFPGHPLNVLCSEKCYMSEFMQSLITGRKVDYTLLPNNVLLSFRDYTKARDSTWLLTPCKIRLD